LVRREPRPEGIQFFAGENATPFLGSLRSDYLVALRERAQWLVSVLGKYTDPEFRNLMRRFSKEWIEEFQAAETSLAWISQTRACQGGEPGRYRHFSGAYNRVGRLPDEVRGTRE
jgi:hypothetical protein